MSPETLAAVIGGAVGGVVGGALGILGAVLGLFAERWMRRWGKVECQLTRRVVTWRVGPDRRELAQVEVDKLADFDLVEAEVAFDLKFFNEMEVDVGLSRLGLVFIVEGGEEVRLEPTDIHQELQTVNVVSRRWSEAKVAGVISGRGSRFVRDYHTIEVRGTFPDHSPYKAPVIKTVTASVRIGGA